MKHYIHCLLLTLARTEDSHPVSLPLVLAPLPPPTLCSQLGALQIIQERGKWLFTFFLGLMVSSIVVQSFDTLLQQHVELAFFVPLIIGHGGNTGSQAISSIIRWVVAGAAAHRGGEG